MKVKIRKVTPKDLKQFRNFARRLVLHDFPGYPHKICQAYWRLEFKYESLVKAITKKRLAILWAKQGRKPLGFVLCYFQNGGGSRIEWLIVTHEYRGLGIGTSLLERAEQIIQKSGRHFVSLHTEEEKNVGYYEKRGYKKVGVQEDAWFHVDETLMQKNW